LASTFFEALGLVSFNISPHYLDPHDKKNFSGESKDDRIKEYQEFHSNNVLGMEEKTMIAVADGNITVAGEGKVKLFIKNQNPKEYKSGEFFTT